MWIYNVVTQRHRITSSDVCHYSYHQDASSPSTTVPGTPTLLFILPLCCSPNSTEKLPMFVTGLDFDRLFVLFIYIPHVNETILYLSFWLISLSIIPSSSIHVAIYTRILFFFFKFEYHTSIHSSVFQHLGWFHNLAIKNGAAIKESKYPF